MPTDDQLQKRRCITVSVCSLCLEDAKTLEHIILRCKVVVIFRNGFSYLLRCSLDWSTFHSLLVLFHRRCNAQLKTTFLSPPPLLLLQIHHLRQFPPRPSLPRDLSNVAALVWFCNDLRLLDNERLTVANNDSLFVLRVYCFDPSNYSKSAPDFDKTGPYRAAFLIHSVSDLRRSLQTHGSDLVVHVKKPETVLAELTKVSYPKCCKREKREKRLKMMKKTIFDSLDENGFSFGIYYQYPPSTLFYSSRNTAKKGNCQTTWLLSKDTFDLLSLPANDDHPYHDVGEGQKFVKEVYEALRASLQWNEMLVVITYDEHGGFYDHVPIPLDGVPSPDGIAGPEPFKFKFDRLGVGFLPSLFLHCLRQEKVCILKLPDPVKLREAAAEEQTQLSGFQEDLIYGRNSKCGS
ncbi:Non-specific phospholipase C4 [Glycine soja]